MNALSGSAEADASIDAASYAVWPGPERAWSGILTGGVLSSCTLFQVGTTAPTADFSFGQLSDSHIGFNNVPNADVVATVQKAIARIAALPTPPAFVLHTGDVSHLSKADEYDTVDQLLLKGREWRLVFVTGIEEGLLPHVRPSLSGQPEPNDDEERRLTYVALSRCQMLLYLTYCRTRRPVIDDRPGRPEPQQPSRYLRGLPPDLIARVA